jgi:hypothetical protein
MLTLKPKQKQILDAVNDPNIHTIVLIGAVGTGKTDIAAHVGISIAYNFPKTYFTVFRQNISTAKRSIIPSYLNMLDMMNLVEKEDYKYNRNEYEILFYHNDSKIGFVEADITKDRQGRKIKGINATANHIDEADELQETMFTMANSRRGRRNQHGQPSISLITMNPNDSFMREKYYNPWHEPEKYGPLPQGVVVIEFTLSDSWQTQEDIEQLKTNPKPWTERYLFNNWDYQDDDNSLFKYRYFQSAIVSMFDVNAMRTVGNDVARSGSDRSVIAQWAGNTLVNIVITKDKTEKVTTDQQAMMLIKYLTENSVLPTNTAVDAVGVGVGVVDHAKSKGISLKEFVSGASPVSEMGPDGKAKPSKYDSLRSQVIWMFAQGLEKGTYKIFEGCPFRNELISEAMAHLHEVTDKQLKVESKDKVKERTGSLSPDIFDAVVMGLYPQLKIDPRSDTNRIIL